MSSLFIPRTDSVRGSGARLSAAGQFKVRTLERVRTLPVYAADVTFPCNVPWCGGFFVAFSPAPFVDADLNLIRCGGSAPQEVFRKMCCQLSLPEDYEFLHHEDKGLSGYYSDRAYLGNL